MAFASLSSRKSSASSVSVPATGDDGKKGEDSPQPKSSTASMDEARRLTSSSMSSGGGGSGSAGGGPTCNSASTATGLWSLPPCPHSTSQEVLHDSLAASGSAAQ
eukprot:CAMPEP_0171072012 /NCGR_PEP_ID=MMETSP0766_2-20121228/10623_1 /TAXON_ID=439317 /ORGANISM="Gambierdiscus australes, Strain CAWD 149" /LENGTH=104 /DNA_ID=CAMNT_0011528571 /DNA_START=79 /DNA_END=393 /DNA_ORIENTATION=+